ncbi:SDR family oxidoreductase [Roseateles noduli]|uniref:SDR family oxidoreductase n=1 Tax=Roseateles noduli TaxID=2052484 RepID=UPI003D6593A4
MSDKTDKKVAFITGANRGIGLETARQLGKLGVLPVIGARNSAAGEEAVAALKAQGVEAQSIKFDILSADDHKSAHDYFKAKFGRLDILINNAGVYLDGEAGVSNLFTPATVPQSMLRDSMDSNFFAPVAITQALLPLLQSAPAGRVVNLSSGLGSLNLVSDPTSSVYGAQSFAYNASKTALNSFTLHLAKMLEGTSVKVNSAHPGWVQTQMGGKLAPMQVEDGAKTSVQLATLPADGPSGGFFHLGEALPW